MKRLLSCLLVVSMVLMGSVNVFAAVASTAKILDISIPTNVSKVRAVVTSPMMCSLSDGWLSLTSINSTVTIN